MDFANVTIKGPFTHRTILFPLNYALPTENKAYVPEVRQSKHLGDRKRLLLEKSQRRQDLCPPRPEALSPFPTPLGRLSEIQ